MAGKRKLAVLPAVLALGALAACAGSGDIPPCTPVEGSDVDPCEAGAGSFLTTMVLHTSPHHWPGDKPGTIQAEIEGRSEWSAIHLVVRATYLPNTVRCTIEDGFRVPPFVLASDGGLRLRCFSDIRVNDYIVGAGPSTLTVVIDSYQMGAAEEHRRRTESWLARIVDGREKIMFIGVELDHSVEAFKVREVWDMVRTDGGAVMVHHLYRKYWLDEDAAKYRSEVEWTVDAFKKEAIAAHEARNAKYDGRIADGPQYPRIIANASNLHDYYVETGAVNHPDGPPRREFPPACGLAVPDYGDNPKLMVDCTVLLALKDTLRGAGALNWSVDTIIAEWDGVTTWDGSVHEIALGNKGLTGIIPPELSKLRGLNHLILQSNQLTGAIPASLESLWQMETLRLSGNSLTGCIPAGLRDVPDHDLDQLGLPDCAGE